jgi:DNA-binding MarR family transcriptional regulator/GNAT superfamily N-acetyltransferase
LTLALDFVDIGIDLTRESGMPPHPSPARIEAIRRFNRFYTAEIGVIGERYLASPFTLAQARVIYELAQREASTEPATAAELAATLGLDPGYLSRLLASLRTRRIVDAALSARDRRRRNLALSVRGRRAFAALNKASHSDMAALLAKLPDHKQRQLVEAMGEIEMLLGTAPARAVLIRSWRPGDIGWVVSRHGALYAEEYGWDASFEGFVAEIAAKFLRQFDAKFENCWIAELDGSPVGSIFLVKQNSRIAKLRMFIVEPQARGLGIGRRLLATCIDFARHTGYREIRLWTNDILHAARKLYEESGFRLIDTERHRSFGKDLVGQSWRLEL